MKTLTRWCMAGAVACLGFAGAYAEAAIELTAVPGGVSVRQEGRVSGADAARIACARGEYESFQVVVTARGTNLRDIQAEISELRSEAGDALPREAVTLYREVFVPVRHSAPRAALPPGLVPDPLVPFINPYTGEPVPEPRWRGDEREGGTALRGGRFRGVAG